MQGVSESDTAARLAVQGDIDQTGTGLVVQSRKP
jgi:hypothetical protein